MLVQFFRSPKGFVYIFMLYFLIEEFRRLFEVDLRSRILICTSCQYAIVPTHLSKHLWTYHKRLTLQQRRAIISAVDELSILARVPSDVVYPSLNDPPITNLPMYFDSLKCSSIDSQGVPYSYIYRTLRGIREHCEQKHSWVNS
jgi:hypothetical protein